MARMEHLDRNVHSERLKQRMYWLPGTRPLSTCIYDLQPLCSVARMLSINWQVVTCPCGACDGLLCTAVIDEIVQYKMIQQTDRKHEQRLPLLGSTSIYLPMFDHAIVEIPVQHTPLLRGDLLKSQRANETTPIGPRQ